MNNALHDCIIIGAGPAGLAASIYTARGRLDTLVIEKGPSGGQITLTDAVENYPGFPEPLSGSELAGLLEKQAEKFEAKFTNATVTDIRRNGKTFTVTADKKAYETRALICATGADPRKLGIPGEDQNVGMGVSYCATCDGAFFRNKRVIVIGGGDAAVEEAMFLTRFASNVTIVHRRDQLRASKILQERAFAHEKIDFIWDSVPVEIVSEGVVKGAVLKNVKTGETKEHPINGVFIFVGHIPNTALFKNLADLDEHGLIQVDLSMRTQTLGLFACGDCRTEAARQMASSVGDGVTAACAAIKYVDEQKAEEA